MPKENKPSAFVTLGFRRELVNEAVEVVKKTWPEMTKSARTSAMNVLIMYGIETLQKQDKTNLPLPDKARVKIGT